MFTVRYSSFMQKSVDVSITTSPTHLIFYTIIILGSWTWKISNPFILSSSWLDHIEYLRLKLQCISKIIFGLVMPYAGVDLSFSLSQLNLCLEIWLYRFYPPPQYFIVIRSLRFMVYTCRSAWPCIKPLAGLVIRGTEGNKGKTLCSCS